MQDNTNFSFDEQFQDQAWEQMSRLLDQEMPKTYPIFIPAPQKDIPRWPMGFTLALMLIFGQQFTPVIEEAPQPVEQKQEVPAVDLNIAQVEEEEVPLIADAGDALRTSMSFIPSSAAAQEKKATSLTKVAQPKVDLGILTPVQSTTKENQSDELILAYTEPKIQKEDPAQDLIIENELEPVRLNISVLEERQIASLTAIETPDAYLEKPNTQPNYRVDPIKVNRPPARFGVSTATLSRDLTDLDGYSVGVIAEIPLDRTFSIETGAHYTNFSNRKHSRALLANSLQNQDVFLNADPASFSDSNMGILPDYNVQYLNVPLLLSYRVNPVLRVSTGLSAGFLMGAKFLEHKDNMLSEEEMMERNKYLKESFRDIDMAAVIGLGFRPMERLEFQMQYRLGMRDYTKDGFYGFRQIDTHRWLQMGLVYFLY